MNNQGYEEEVKKGIYSKRAVLKAIKLKCFDCCGGSWEEVKKCSCGSDCFLHPFRLGKNPFLKKELTDEQRERIRNRFLKIKNQ